MPEEEIQADNDRFQSWTSCISKPSEEHKDNRTELGLGLRYHICPVAARALSGVHSILLNLQGRFYWQILSLNFEKRYRSYVTN